AVAAAPGSFWWWPADAPADHPGEGGPRIGPLMGELGKINDFDQILAGLRPEHAIDLGKKVALLRTGGTSFKLRVESPDRKRIFDAEGRRSVGPLGSARADAVWFTDVGDTAVKTAELLTRAEQLIAKNKEYRDAFDLFGIPVWARGEGLELVYCNQAFADAVEAVNPEAAVATGAEITSGPTGWGRELAAEAVKTRSSVMRSTHVVVGGARKFMEITEFPIGTAVGGWRVVGFAVDRSEDEETKADLSRHVMGHDDVLERLGTGIVIFGRDTRVQFFNTAFARMWGLDEVWLKTLPTHGEILEDLRARRVYPDHPDFQEFKRRVMALYTSLIEPQEELLYLPDERAFRMVTNLHPMGGLLVTYEDVTDRLALERSYNTLIAVQSETLANLHEGVVVFGSDGRIRLSNPGYARIWNLEPETLKEEPRLADIIDSAQDLFIYEGPWETFRDKILAGILDRTSKMGRFERSDGSVIDYAAVPLPDGAMMFSYIDVTDTVSVQRALRERNEALLAADHLKSQFITNVSYELRTPLNSIIGFTEILENQYFGKLNKRQSEYTQGVLQASQLLLSLIDNILDLALIDAGRLELERSEIDIHTMMDSVITLTRALKPTEVFLELICPDDIGTLDGDERRLKQALINLMTNAIAHTPAQERVQLTASREQGSVSFSVSDTGPGIAEEDIERVMGRFETGHGEGARGKGLGLGLALVKSFVELHGGELFLQSRLGEGTKVSFHIPDGAGASAGPPPGQGGESDSAP
ncbi:MAG: PAS-domain containing protein, partial [Alphaproteobacteria bacterium]|nr:PAS-domain containing protein [Alphaproteobacteria bacterium]